MSPSSEPPSLPDRASLPSASLTAGSGASGPRRPAESRAWSHHCEQGHFSGSNPLSNTVPKTNSWISDKGVIERQHQVDSQRLHHALSLGWGCGRASVALVARSCGENALAHHRRVAWTAWFKCQLHELRPRKKLIFNRLEIRLGRPGPQRRGRRHFSAAMDLPECRRLARRDASARSRSWPPP